VFAACDGNARLLLVDLDRMRVTAAYRVGRSPDALAFDLGLGRLYVGSESGTVTVFAERAGRLVRLGAGVMPHAHAVAVDPRTHLVYLPLEREAGRPVLRVMAPTPGPGEGVTGNGRAMLAMQWRSPGPVASLERCAAAR